MVIVLVALCGLGLVGCASQSGQSGASAAAERFLDAVTRGDAATACALLTLRTRHGLTVTEGEPCEQSLPVDELGRGPVEQADTWSDQSIVEGSGSTLFLARFDDRWLVSAAGCRPNGDAPYQCLVGG